MCARVCVCVCVCVSCVRVMNYSGEAERSPHPLSFLRKDSTPRATKLSTKLSFLLVCVCVLGCISVLDSQPQCVWGGLQTVVQLSVPATLH